MRAGISTPATNIGRLDRQVDPEHLEPGGLRIRGWGNVADGATFTNVLQPGPLLFGKRRAYQRKGAMANFSGVCSGDSELMSSAVGRRTAARQSWRGLPACA